MDTITISKEEYDRLRNTQIISELHINSLLKNATLSYNGKELSFRDEEELVRILYPEQYQNRLEEVESCG